MKKSTTELAYDARAEGFSDEEREAMKARVREMKAEAQAGKKGGKADGESDVLAAITAMPEPDRSLAEGVHSIVKTAAPSLSPKTWYGMPAYANAQGKVVCFFQSAAKFKTRYATFGFQHDAGLDDGNMWPVAFALTALTPVEEATISELVKRATS